MGDRLTKALSFQTHASPTSPSVRLPTSPSPQIQSGVSHHQGMFSGQLPLQLQMMKAENKNWSQVLTSFHYLSLNLRYVLSEASNKKLVSCAQGPGAKKFFEAPLLFN